MPKPEPLGLSTFLIGRVTLSLVLYRDVLAERRRLDETFPWHLTGVVIHGTWSPATEGISPPTIRQIEAGGVELVSLPAFLASDDASAVAAAIDVARMVGCGESGPERLPGGYRATVEIGREPWGDRVWR